MSIINIKYGSKPGFLGPAPKFFGIDVVDRTYKNSKTACVNGYVSLRLSTCSNSDSTPEISVIEMLTNLLYLINK